MDSIRVTYKLKLLNGDNYNTQEIVRAVGIYKENTPVHEKTSGDDFIYWAEHSKDYSPDKILLFGFYKDDELVGFGQLAYFNDEKILVLDYMTLDRKHSSNNVFFEFYSQIITYMHVNCFDFDYIISEIPFVEEGMQPSCDEKLWIKLLEMQSFKRIKATYYQPSLTDRNPETETSGILMVFQRHQTNVIKKETLIMFVDTLYFKHYARWYAPRFKDAQKLSEYIGKLNSFKTVIIKSVVTNEVRLDGRTNLLPVIFPEQKSGKKGGTLTFVIPSIAVIVLLISALLIAWKIFDFNKEQFAVVAGTVSVLFFGLLATVSEEARGLFKDVLRRTSFFTKKD